MIQHYFLRFKLLNELHCIIILIRPSLKSHNEKICAFLDAHNGILTQDQAQEGLALVHWQDLPLPNGRVEDTQYSNVYDQTALTLRLRNWNDYDTVCKFFLK